MGYTITRPDGKPLVVEINSKRVADPGEGSAILFTPPVGDEGYWSYRVQLTDTQAIVGFPKFMQIGIGFALETDWNTNLPSTADAEKIWNHIAHNAGDPAITREVGVTAIRMLQGAITAGGADAV